MYKSPAEEKAYRKQYRQEHRNYFSSAQKKYYQENKEARLIYHEKYRKENRDKILQRQKTYYKNNPLPLAKSLWIGAKARAKKANLEFTITPEDIQIPEFCPALGIKLNRHLGSKAQDDSFVLERFNNDLGYIPMNINVVSHKANRMKTNATIQEVEGLLTWMKLIEKSSLKSILVSDD